MIPQRELHNKISQALRQVEADERLRVTVDGRPVADLVPVGDRRRVYGPREEVAKLLARAPLDATFARDLRAAVGATIGDL